MFGYAVHGHSEVMLGDSIQGIKLDRICPFKNIMLKISLLPALKKTPHFGQPIKTRVKVGGFLGGGRVVANPVYVEQMPDKENYELQ